MTVSERVVPVTLTAAVGTNQTVVTGAKDYRGFALENRSLVARARLRVYDSAAGVATGPILDVITLNAGESSREVFDTAVMVFHGIVVEVVFGVVEGSIHRGM